MTVRTAIVGSLSVWAVIVVATYIAGEQTEVAVLRVHDEAGKEYATDLWIVDIDEATWVRVANPRRTWYRRLLANPVVSLERGGRIEKRLAIPDDSPQARLAVDAAFAEKYGWVDRWYGLLVRRGAIPIRLVPAPR